MKFILVLSGFLLAFAQGYAFQNCDGNYAFAEIIVVIHNTPSSIKQYSVEKSDGSWITRKVANFSTNDIKIRIDTDGVTDPADSTYLNLSENTSATITFGDYSFVFSVGAETDPNLSPDSKFELDYNLPVEIIKCQAGAGFTECDLTYAGPVILIDQKFSSSSSGNIRLTSGTALQTSEGNLVKVPHIFTEYWEIQGVATTYSITSVDLAERFYHDWFDQDENNRSFNYIKTVSTNGVLSSKYEATQLPKYTFTPQTGLSLAERI